jgi:hypothetical protein
LRSSGENYGFIKELMENYFVNLWGVKNAGKNSKIVF